MMSASALLPAPRRRAWLFGLGALGVACCQSTRAQPLPQKRPWSRTVPTPALQLPGEAGQLWRLADQRGQVVVLNFWASWCEPCRAELPSLELLAARHDAQGLRVLAVNFRETDAALRRFTERHPLSLPILRDVDGAAARAFAVRIFPTTVVVGREGRVLFSVVGEADWGAEPVRGWIGALFGGR